MNVVFFCLFVFFFVFFFFFVCLHLLASLTIHNVPSEDSVQTARMRSLIWIYAGRKCPKVRFLTLRLLYSKASFAGTDHKILIVTVSNLIKDQNSGYKPIKGTFWYGRITKIWTRPWSFWTVWSRLDLFLFILSEISIYYTIF